MPIWSEYGRSRRVLQTRGKEREGASVVSAAMTLLRGCLHASLTVRELSQVGRSPPDGDRQHATDSVEKVGPRFFRLPCEKIDLSDRPTNRSRASVKGKRTPENLARKTVDDFFNTIDPKGTVVLALSGRSISLRPSARHNCYARPALLILLLCNSPSVGIDADTSRISPNHHRKKIVKSIRCNDINRVIVP